MDLPGWFSFRHQARYSGMQRDRRVLVDRTRTFCYSKSRIDQNSETRAGPAELQAPVPAVRGDLSGSKNFCNANSLTRSATGRKERIAERDAELKLATGGAIEGERMKPNTDPADALDLATEPCEDCIPTTRWERRELTPITEAWLGLCGVCGSMLVVAPAHRTR